MIASTDPNGIRFRGISYCINPNLQMISKAPRQLQRFEHSPGVACPPLHTMRTVNARNSCT